MIELICINLWWFVWVWYGEIWCEEVVGGELCEVEVFEWCFEWCDGVVCCCVCCVLLEKCVIVLFVCVCCYCVCVLSVVGFVVCVCEVDVWGEWWSVWWRGVVEWGVDGVLLGFDLCWRVRDGDVDVFGLVLVGDVDCVFGCGVYDSDEICVVICVCVLGGGEWGVGGDEGGEVLMRVEWTAEGEAV